MSNIDTVRLIAENYGLANMQIQVNREILHPSREGLEPSDGAIQALTAALKSEAVDETVKLSEGDFVHYWIANGEVINPMSEFLKASVMSHGSHIPRALTEPMVEVTDLPTPTPEVLLNEEQQDRVQWFMAIYGSSDKTLENIVELRHQYRLMNPNEHLTLSQIVSEDQYRDIQDLVTVSADEFYIQGCADTPLMQAVEAYGIKLFQRQLDWADSELPKGEAPKYLEEDLAKALDSTQVFAEPNPLVGNDQTEDLQMSPELSEVAESLNLLQDPESLRKQYEYLFSEVKGKTYDSFDRLLGTPSKVVDTINDERAVIRLALEKGWKPESVVELMYQASPVVAHIRESDMESAEVKSLLSEQVQLEKE